MKVAVVYFPVHDRSKLQDAARGLAQGIESNGHTADLIDGHKDIHTKLTMYEYIAVGAEADGIFGGKISAHVAKFLASAGIVSGKRCFAFITPKGLRTLKTLKVLMDVMEHEGMYLLNSQIVASFKEAETIGKTIA